MSVSGGELHLGQIITGDGIPQVEAILTDGVDGNAESGDGIFEQHIVQEVHLVTAEHILRDEKPLTEVLALELTNQVTTGDKAGDIYAVTEEVVFDSIDLSVYIIILFSRCANKFFKNGATDTPQAMENGTPSGLSDRLSADLNSASKSRIMPTPFSSCVCSS